MGKSAEGRHSIRPSGRAPVISGRVHALLHQRIQEAAKASGRTMSEELAALATEAFQHRDRYGSAEARRVVEWLALSFTMAGEAAARGKGIRLTGSDWVDDPECRQAAALRLCEVALTGFMSADPREQLRAASLLRNRMAEPVTGKRVDAENRGAEQEK